MTEKGFHVIYAHDLRRALAEAAEQQAATAETLKVISASPNTACSVNWAFCGVYAP